MPFERPRKLRVRRAIAIFMIKPLVIIFSLMILLFCTAPLAAQSQITSAKGENPTTQTVTHGDSSTDFLSDDQWRQLPRQERQGRFRRAFLSRLEPTGQPAVERLPEYIQRYKAAVIFDNRLGVFNVRGTLLDKSNWAVQLEGEVSVAQYAQGLVSALHALGFRVDKNAVEILPHRSLGREIYGVSTTTAATMRREPRANAEQVNSIALGWPIRLLRPARPDDLTTPAQNEGTQRRGMRRWRSDETSTGEFETGDVGEWFFAQSADGYVGFVSRSEFERLDHYALPSGILSEPTTVTQIQNENIQLPMGTGLHLRESSWEVPFAKHSISFRSDETQGKFIPLVITETKILEITKPLVGTKYVWGGVTERGIDCSGFTQLVYRALGINLPRDAEEQAIVGSIVAFGPDVIPHAQPGDLIFFVNDYGRISHVAISLGGERIIHSSQRDVHISTLYESREDSSDRLIDRVLYARRIAGLHVLMAKGAAPTQK